MRSRAVAVSVVLMGCAELPQDPAGSRSASVITEGATALGSHTGVIDAADFVIWRKDLGGPDIIDFDIQNGFVFDGPASPENLLLNIHDGAILDAAGAQVLCRFDGASLLDAQTGAVIFTTDGRNVYEGRSRVRRFWFKKENLLEGAQTDQRIVATASVDLSRVAVERKLLVAALYSAHCGAPVLDS